MAQPAGSATPPPVTSGGPSKTLAPLSHYSHGQIHDELMQRVWAVVGGNSCPCPTCDRYRAAFNIIKQVLGGGPVPPDPCTVFTTTGRISSGTGVQGKVHILEGGSSICKAVKGVPSSWPPGHTWCRASDVATAKEPICPFCLDALMMTDNGAAQVVVSTPPVPYGYVHKP